VQPAIAWRVFARRRPSIAPTTDAISPSCGSDDIADEVDHDGVDHGNEDKAADTRWICFGGPVKVSGDAVGAFT